MKKHLLIALIFVFKTLNISAQDTLKVVIEEMNFQDNFVRQEDEPFAPYTTHWELQNVIEINRLFKEKKAQFFTDEKAALEYKLAKKLKKSQWKKCCVKNVKINPKAVEQFENQQWKMGWIEEWVKDKELKMNPKIAYLSLQVTDNKTKTSQKKYIFCSISDMEKIYPKFKTLRSATGIAEYDRLDILKDKQFAFKILHSSPQNQAVTNEILHKPLNPFAQIIDTAVYRLLKEYIQNHQKPFTTSTKPECLIRISADSLDENSVPFIQYKGIFAQNKQFLQTLIEPLTDAILEGKIPIYTYEMFRYGNKIQNADNQDLRNILQRLHQEYYHNTESTPDFDLKLFYDSQKQQVIKGLSQMTDIVGKVTKTNNTVTFDPQYLILYFQTPTFPFPKPFTVVKLTDIALIKFQNQPIIDYLSQLQFPYLVVSVNEQIMFSVEEGSVMAHFLFKGTWERLGLLSYLRNLGMNQSENARESLRQQTKRLLEEGK